MGVLAKLLRRRGRNEEAAAQPAEPEPGAEGAKAEDQEAAEETAAGGAGIPKQQSAEGAADSDANDDARQ